jgi:hypothetical protein
MNIDEKQKKTKHEPIYQLTTMANKRINISTKKAEYSQPAGGRTGRESKGGGVSGRKTKGKYQEQKSGAEQT